MQFTHRSLKMEIFWEFLKKFKSAVSTV